MKEKAMEFPVTVESQDDFDALVKDRLTRERQKFADYDEIKAERDTLAQAATEHQQELDAATQRATEAETWKADREAADQLAQVRQEVAQSTGVPAAALRGGSKEELEAHAAELKPILTATQRPVIPTQGDFPENVDPSPEGDFVSSLFGNGD